MAEAQFQPRWDEKQTRQVIDSYKGRAHMLRPQEQEMLEQHAAYHQVPFYTGDFSIMDAIKEAGKGFFSGFTTYTPSSWEPPDNEYEAIFNNIGHLAGFAPSLAAKPLKALGATGLARQAASLKSIPMKAADLTTDFMKTQMKDMGFVGRSDALKTAKNFYLGEKAKHVAEGAFHLGIASGASAWQGGIDGMLESAQHGALFGGVFRVLGNLIPGSSTHETIAKSVAGSLFQGLPATMRGATTPEQVYEYVMGAYFGGNEISWSKAKGNKFVQKVAEKMTVDPKFAAISRGDPEFHPEYKDLAPPVQKEAKAIAKDRFKDPDVQRGIAFATLKELNELDKIVPDIKKRAEKVEFVDGEEVYKINKEDIPKLQGLVMSGGAEGADAFFAEVANEKGKGVIHYTFKGHDKKIKATGFKRSLSTEELQDANSAVEQANRVLQRTITEMPEDKLNLLRRNHYQVKFSDAIYAVADIASDKSDNYRYETTYVKDKKTKKKVKKTKAKWTGNQWKTVKGGTGWAVQMGIDAGKPVYVFDQTKNGWYTFNTKANRFVRIKEPPKPSNRFAGVGTRKLRGNGRKAIKELFDKYWMDTDPLNKKVATTADNKEQQTKTFERLENIDLRLDKLTAQLEEIRNQEVLAKNRRASQEEISEILAPRESLNKEFEMLTTEKNQLQNLGVSIESKEAPVSNPEDVISANDDIAAKQDSNFEGKADIEIGKRAHQFAKRHLRKLWTGSVEGAGDSELTSLKVGTTVEQLLNAKDPVTNESLYIKRGSKEIKSEEFANDLESRIAEEFGVNVSLDPAARGEIRQWINIKNNGKMVTHLQSDGKTVNRMVNDSNPRSKMGNRKHQVEPKKHIEFVFEDIGGKVDRNQDGYDINPVYMVLDHVTVETKDGRRDLDLSRFRQHLLKEAKFNQEVADAAYDKYISNAMKEMVNQGYYAFGGRADGDKIHWVRFHPLVEQNWNSTEGLRKYAIDILRAGKESDPKFLHDYAKARELFTKKYGEKIGVEYEKMYISNILYDLSMNGMDINFANMKTLMGKGFIKDSKAFNKRSQIWFTNGYSGDTNFIKEVMVDGQKVKLNKNDAYNYVIVNDLPKTLLEGLSEKELKEYQSMLTTMNIHNAEHVDGAIIVRDDILEAMSKDFGVPTSTGQNKSFIIQKNPDLGALLGKFMFHSAGQEMSQLMRDNGNLHMIMQDSAVKQRGKREIGDYFIDSDKDYSALDKKEIEMVERGKDARITIDAPVYELKPEEVFGSYGVYGNNHMISKQGLPKQVLGNLVPLSKTPIKQEVIDNMFEEIIGKRWRGDDLWNEKVDLYLDKMAKGTGKAEDIKRMEIEIENNIDSIGIETLIRAMKNDHSPKLTEAIYNRILKVEKNNAYEDFIEGNITESEYNSYIAEMSESTNIIDKVVRLSNEWVKEQKALGVDMSGTPIYMHKFIRDFRMKAVQNFIVNSATKPKMSNSGVGFIRPYDKAMQFLDGKTNKLLDINNKEGINYKDDLFFLDNDFRKMVVETDLVNYEKVALGRLWDAYQAGQFKGKNKEYIEEVFRAATVRVPMDSISGTQVLKFGGFTGRKGHGILMHSRAMRAEGGADLDGDKSFFFFGGKGGWKKEWKDAYESNKNEHYNEKETVVTDNKTSRVGKSKRTYTDLLSQTFSPEEKRQFNSKAFQFAPGERLRISQAAVDGRNLLGPAVIQKQVMTSAFNSIVAGGGEDKIVLESWKDGKKVFYQATIKARTDKDALREQRKLGRAQLGLASDPLDVLGLKTKNEWFDLMWHAHFDIVDIKTRTGGGRWKKLPKHTEIDLEPRHLKAGILKDYYDINSAYWGRNHKEGRKHSMDEIKNLGKAIYNINENPKRVNNILAKTGELLQGHDWSDSIFGRLEKSQVEALYNAHIGRVRQFDWLKRMLGTSSFKTPMGNYINNTMEFSLWKDINVVENGKIVGGLDGVANSTALFKKAVNGTLFAKDKNLMERAIKNEEGVRKNILRQIRALAEDFIVNDMTDLSTLNNVSRIIEQMKESGDFGVKNAKDLEDAVDIIHRKVDYLKKRSYLMRNDRNNAEAHYSRDFSTLGAELDNLDRMLRESAFGIADIKNMSTRDRKRIREVGDDITSALDQATIDLKITDFKKDLSPLGQKLFDHLMLGSLSRYNLDRIDKIAASMDKMDKTARDLIHHYRKLAAKTQTSRLGFNSEAVDTGSVKEHIGSYLGMYKQMWRAPDSETIAKNLNKVDTKLEDPAVMEEVRIPDDPLHSFLREGLMESGYAGIKKAKLSKQEKSLASEIATLLKSFGNNKLGQDLNLIARGILNKDLNVMNYQDFLYLRNYLQEAKRGNFLQRWKKRLGITDDGPVGLGLRHWLQIPETVGRELMVDDIQKMYTTGYFTDRHGVMREGRVVKPTNYIDMANNWYSMMVDKATGEGDRLIGRFQKDINFITGLDDADAIWRVAIRKRELDYAADIRNNPEKYPDRKVEAGEAMKHIYAEHSKVLKETGWTKNMRDKVYTVTIDGKRGNMTGQQLVKKINKKLDVIFEDMHKFIRGEPGALDPYIIGYWDPGTQLAPKIDYKKFIRHMQEHLTGGKTPWKDIARGEVPNIFGIDGLRAVARSMQLDLMPTKTPQQRAARNKIAKQPVFSTGKISKGYFPHMFFDAQVAKERMKAASEKILKTPDSEMSPEDKKKELIKLQYRNRSLEGDWNFKDMEEYDMFNEVLEDLAKNKQISERTIKWFNSNERAGSMHARTSLSGGYSIDPTVVEAYMRSLSNTYYRQLSQMFGRHIVDKMGKEMPKKWGLDQTKAWQQWMMLYSNDAIGNPTVIPERVYNDPKMKLKMSPYGWWADNRVRDRINWIGGKLGLTNKDLPKELRGIDIDTVRWWSNLEAQYEMAALLAHPKSTVMNIFGGSLHTMQNAGIGNWIKAQKMSYLSKINPKWTSREAINQFAISHGVVPEFLLYEMGLQKTFQSDKGRSLIRDIRTELERNPDKSIKDMGHLSKKHGKEIWEKAVNWAGKFMTIPEKKLRTDAFMAHYIHAWEKFGGAIKDYDHPFLIEMAKKGVKATQFLYNAPNRPAFARTALGKVFSRFQLYAWNSVKFRNEVRRQLRIAGYQPGTDAYERFQRTLIIDTFCLALANAYQYSMFNQNLPQPYGWLQDTAEWVFGDEAERDRAFYGAWPTEVAPLQAVTPPILRMTGPTVKAMLTDDWSKMSSYYIWSMFPFGRIARDVAGPGNLLEVPSRAWEKLFGIPMQEIQRAATKAKKEREEEEALKQEEEDQRWF
jgi:hypothetical protein